MNIFMTNPEAVEYGADQAWLSPPEALSAALQPQTASPLASREDYRSYLTQRADRLRTLLRRVEDELHYLGRA